MGIKERGSGFTIVELLIVIVVIAILAAISILTFTGVQSRAKSAAITQEFKQLDKSFRLWATEEGFTRWPPDTLSGGGTNITNMINSGTPPFASLKSYIQKNPSVNGIGTESWFYDQDDYSTPDVAAGYGYCIANPTFHGCIGDDKTECSANEPSKLAGVNIMIRFLPQSDEAIAKRVNDAFDSGETSSNWDDCGKIRWYNHGNGTFIIVYSLSYTKLIAS